MVMNSMWHVKQVIQIFEGFNLRNEFNYFVVAKWVLVNNFFSLLCS